MAGTRLREVVLHLPTSRTRFVLRRQRRRARVLWLKERPNDGLTMRPSEREHVKWTLLRATMQLKLPENKEVLWWRCWRASEPTNELSRSLEMVRQGFPSSIYICIPIHTHIHITYSLDHPILFSLILLLPHFPLPFFLPHTWRVKIFLSLLSSYWTWNPRYTTMPVEMIIFKSLLPGRIKVSPTRFLFIYSTESYTWRCDITNFGFTDSSGK